MRVRVRCISKLSLCSLVRTCQIRTYHIHRYSSTSGLTTISPQDITKSVDEAFTKAFNEANQHYEEDRLDECITQARALLADTAIPRYHRMRTLVLLGSCLGDWYEANSCCTQAEALWRIVRRWHPAGDNKNIDTAMTDIRESIDELEEALQEDLEPERDVEGEVEAAVAAHDAS